MYHFTHWNDDDFLQGDRILYQIWLDDMFFRQGDISFS